jgi:hypothetical protein
MTTRAMDELIESLNLPISSRRWIQSAFVQLGALQTEGKAWRGLLLDNCARNSVDRMDDAVRHMQLAAM